MLFDHTLPNISLIKPQLRPWPFEASPMFDARLDAITGGAKT